MDGDDAATDAEGDGEGDPEAPSTIDRDLHRRTQALLEPGDIELVGAIVHTDLGSDEDIEMHRVTVEVGERIAAHALEDPADCYVYSGTDDPRFASNQHQGLTISGDEFVWECQQLLRSGTFDLVFYYEADVDQAALLDDLRGRGHRVTGVEPESSSGPSGDS